MTLENPFVCKEIKSVNPKGNQPWIFTGRTDAEAEAPVLWPPDANSSLTGKRPWCWERLKAKGEEGDRGWDGWMASPTQWTWVRASSGRWWKTGQPGGLKSMGLQRVSYGWATSLSFFRFSSIAQLCLTLCDSTVRSTPGSPVLHDLPEFAQIHVHWVSDDT